MNRSPHILRPALSDRRNYVHAADLFDALSSTMGSCGDVTLVLKNLSDAALELRFDKPEPRHLKFAGTVSFTAGHTAGRAWLRQVEGERIMQRTAQMDADALTGICYHADSASGVCNSGFSIAKAALVLAVGLLETLAPEDAWNLAELAVKHRATPGDRIEVRIVRRIDKFAVISVMSDDSAWGRFILASTPYLGEMET